MPISTIEMPAIPVLQILDEEGKVDPELEPILSDDQVTQMYRTMLLAREADQKLLKLQRQGRMGTVPLCTGQEAASLGPAFAMQEGDWLSGAFREFAGRLHRGEPLVNYFLTYNGYEEGNVLPTDPDPRILPISVIVGGQFLHATGIAYAMKYRREDSAVVSFGGDGSTSEGDFHEALNFAAVWQAPVVFVIQNNKWAISIPSKNQMRSETIAQKAIAYGIPGIQVDGNDALATYQATKDALARARAGDGPTLIEAVTYRLLMHTTADDPSKYRTPEEEKEHWAREPLVRFRAYLCKRGIWDDEKEGAMRAEVNREIDEAVQTFESMVDFKQDAAFDHVYGTPNPEIEAQRAAFLRDQASAAAKEKHSA